VDLSACGCRSAEFLGVGIYFVGTSAMSVVDNNPNPNPKPTSVTTAEALTGPT